MISEMSFHLFMQMTLSIWILLIKGSVMHVTIDMYPASISIILSRDWII